ncbi:MAG: glycosyltransferase [Rhodothermaceae bacterium]|nr:glycosyltransferase [Rhodothermaceae bacterium]
MQGELRGPDKTRTATGVSARQIALVGPFSPYRGGIAHFLRTMARGLTARGHAVRAYTFRRQYPERLFPGKTQLEDGPPDGLTAPRLLDPLSPLTWTRTARQIADDRADVVVFKYWMPFFAPAFGTLARRLRKRDIQVLAVVDNALPHERRPGDRALGRYVLGACDGLIVMSDQVRRDVESLRLGVPVRQVAHPVYDVFGEAIPKAEARATLGLPAEAPVLLFFGFIRRYKGLHVLLDAMARVRERLPEAKLVVAGEFYADEVALRAQAAPLGAAVRFEADYIPDEAVGRYFGAADVVVQPYVSATQSGVAQIAFHFGRPVITTDVGGLAEIVPDGEAGLVVPPEEPKALAAAIVRFFEEDLEATLAGGVRRERTKYSWDRLYEALEALWTVKSTP